MRYFSLPFIVSLLAVGLVSPALAAPNKAMRPFRIDDIFRRERIDFAAVSPDGELIAFTRRRFVANALDNPVSGADLWI